MEEDKPIVVKESSTSGQLMTGLRSVLTALAAYAVGRGWIDEATGTGIVGIGVILLPMLWSQYTSKQKHDQLRTLANEVPNSVGRVVK